MALLDISRYAIEALRDGGDPLDRHLGAPFELMRFLRISAGLSHALGQIHAAGLVHNDVRPGNVVLDSSECVHITGFDITSRTSIEPRGLASELSLTSLAYMAPEQTGRINRTIDARSDLYSLGIILYEMLTGALPFTASDPLEWIHCHIARTPPPPSERGVSLPAAVEAIVMRLLAKNPEERYQTAAGVHADLSRCLRELQTHGQIESFALGEHDGSKRFVAGDKLLGRDAESRALTTAFDRVSAHGTSQVFLLSGPAGIGKSAILGELRRSLASTPSQFAFGKSAQYGTSTPLAPLRQALHSLVRPLLIKNEAELAVWRAALLEALGTEGQLIIDAIPELALIIGEQPAAPEHPSRDAQERFFGVLTRFLGVFARPQHPLTLCLDDLQWFDGPALEILERLAVDPGFQHLLLVGTYRDDEVDASHPLTRTITRIRASTTDLTEVSLAPLTLADTAQLVADGMRVELARVQPLAAFVFEKSSGNPFFTIQLVTALAGEELLVFDAARGRFEHSSDLTDSRDERARVAELNLVAGKRARFAAAYASALTYFETGLAWLGPDAWTQSPQLAFELELQRITCEFSIGALPAAKEHLSALSERPLEIVDLPALVDIEVKIYTHTGESGRAVEACLAYLRRFDVVFPLHPTLAELRVEYDEVRKRIEGRSISSFIDLPLMVDPQRRAFIDVLSSLMAPSGIFDPILTALTMLRIVSFSLDHGNSDPACAAYAGMAQFLGPLFGDYRTSYEFVALAVELVETRGLTDFKSRVFGMYGAMVIPWLKHIREGYSFSARASEVPAGRDQPTYAYYAWWQRTAIRFDCGDSLEEVHAEAQRAHAFVTKSEFAFAIALVNGPLKLARTLLGLTSRFGSFDEDDFIEEPYEQYLEANPLLTHATVRYWIRKLQARFHAEDYTAALAAATRAQRRMAATLRSFEFAEYHFYAALSHAALCPGIRAADANLDAITAHHAELQSWAEECPANYSCRAELVTAELARLTGRELDAERLYERAIQLSRQHAFVQNEALSNELAARFHAARGFETIAGAYLQHARDCYERWGARAKVQHLDARNPRLRSDHRRSPSTASGARVDPFDLAAMLKVAQALSGEIVLNSLIETLMRIVIEHAGAERGCLILLRNGEPQMAAKASIASGDVAVTHRASPVSADDLPESALQYVIRTRESVILDDASANGLFASDMYVQRHRPKSVLCMPLVKQAELVGALYLQNSLTAGAFTPNRITVLEFVASQAAISLENAYLYADLQRSEAFLSEGQKLSHTASWSLNVVTGEVRWSDEHYRIFEWDPHSDPVPTWDSSIQKVHVEDRPLLQQKFDVARRERTALSFDFRLDFGYRLKYLLGVGRPILDESGEVTGFVGTTMDVTDRRHAEDALRNALADLEHVNRLTTMGELAASIAHEINQPLAAIAANAASCVSWLTKDPPNVDRARTAAERISKNSHHAADIIKSIRAMATKTPELTPLDIDEVIHEVVDLMQTELRRHEVQPIVSLTGEALPIRGNRVQLQQVMVNLITNGIAAMKGVQRYRILRVSRNNTDNREVVVAVEDCGSGIDTQVVSRIFDPLFTTKREGLGMGLAICRSIVEAHGGRIWISPSDPHGSVFSFSVPSS
jgi:predicted ATPase/signal transduction histidine kinase/GAF domain-containing protein